MGPAGIRNRRKLNKEDPEDQKILYVNDIKVNTISCETHNNPGLVSEKIKERCN